MTWWEQAPRSFGLEELFPRLEDREQSERDEQRKR
jgi:hypothetical protein